MPQQLPAPKSKLVQVSTNSKAQTYIFLTIRPEKRKKKQHYLNVWIIINTAVTKVL